MEGIITPPPGIGRAEDDPIPATPSRLITVRRLLPDEDLLAYAYLQIQSDGLLEFLFWESPPRNVIEWMNWCALPSSIIAGVFVEDSGGPPVLAGLGILDKISRRGDKRVANVSEVLFRKFQVARITKEMAEQLLEFAFNVCGMDCIFGVTPRANRPAVLFMQHMGFRFTDPIPMMCSWRGASDDGIISWMKRGDWENRK